MARRKRNISEVLEEVRVRLKEIRTENPRYRRGLRRWVEFIYERTHYRVAYTTARRYEEGEFPLTAEYLLAVCMATDTNPAWVLSGSGPTRWSDVGKPNVVEALEEVLNRVRNQELVGA